MNEGINGVCFGWGTTGGRAAEGAETVRDSSKRPAAGRNHNETTVSLCVKWIRVLSANSQMFGNTYIYSSDCSGDR